MVSSTNSNLNDFVTNGEATTLDNINQSSPQSTIEKFDALQSWNTTVLLPDVPEVLYLGGQSKQDSYQLFYHPTETSQGFAGELLKDTKYRKNSKRTSIVFQPSGESPTDDQPFHLIDELTVSQHSRSEILDQILPYFRTHVTKTDWHQSNPRPGYEDRVKAFNILLDYYTDTCKDADWAFDISILNSPKIDHAIGRYQLNARDFMSCVSQGINSHSEMTIYDINPETVRQFIFNFTADIVEIDDMSEAIPTARPAMGSD